MHADQNDDVHAIRNEISALHAIEQMSLYWCTIDGNNEFTVDVNGRTYRGRLNVDS